MRRLILLLAAVALVGASVAHAAITGSDGADQINGTPGDDTIFARGGDDTIDGQAGNDDISGGEGADDIHGGLGVDAATYGDSSGVSVTIDDVANDGAAGERDNVHRDVEQVYGSPGADTLTGDTGANLLDGGAGPDSISGASGRDALFGGAGPDTINSVDDAVDLVDCGEGSDTVTINPGDLVQGCEQVTRESAQRAQGIVRNFWLSGPSFTRVVTLDVVNISPADAVVAVTCRGRGCPFKSRRTELKGNAKPVRLTAIFKGRKLRVGTRIEIRITAAGAIGKYVSYTVRRSKVPRRRTACLSPGDTKPVKCT